MPCTSYLLAAQTLQVLGREIARFQQTYDVKVTPTLAEPSVSLGIFPRAAEDPMSTLVRDTAFVPFTPFCNAPGLPIGTHFVGRFGDEATLFRLAARPWADRRPRIGR